MSQHTPGPWHHSGRLGDGICAGGCGGTIAQLPMDTSNPERVANARLIAAAPEMREIIVELLAILAVPKGYAQGIVCDRATALLATIDGGNGNDV